MAEAAEIPEAESPFGKRVAVTIAIVAVVMAIISNRGDDAKTDALLKSTQVANAWSHYQSKTIKENTYKIQAKILALEGAPGSDATARGALAKAFAEQAERYKGDEAEIEAEARKLEVEVQEALTITNRCDQATLFMQLAVVACSVAILANLAMFWWGGMAVALVGIALGVSSFWVQPELQHGKQAQPANTSATAPAPAGH